jgi:uncharacterized protein HemX
MSKRLTERQGWIWLLAMALLLGCSLWQTQRLRAVQLEEKKAHYAQRLRTAQVIVENEMLAAAFLTSVDAKTRERARYHLERNPE